MKTKEEMMSNMLATQLTTKETQAKLAHKGRKSIQYASWGTLVDRYPTFDGDRGYHDSILRYAFSDTVIKLYRRLQAEDKTSLEKEITNERTLLDF